MYDFSNITMWIHNLLMSFLPEWATLLIEFVLWDTVNPVYRKIKLFSK